MTTAAELDPGSTLRAGPAWSRVPAPVVAFVAGVLAAGAALATGEVLSGFSAGVPSLVLAVADVFVAETPGPVVRWSIETFGASQKTILVTGVAIGALVLGGVFGVLARTQFWRGASGFLAFGAVGGWAAARGPMSSDFWAWVSALAAAGVGIVALRAMLRAVPASTREVRVDAAPTATPMGTVERRSFLLVAGITATWAVVGTGIGRMLRQARNVEAARTALADQLGEVTPPDINPAEIETFDTAVSGITPIVTPNSDFYRIDTALLVPQVDPADWSLRVSGMVDQEVELTLDDLLGMDRLEEYITISCVSNEVGGDLVGNALWSGVALSSVLDLAGVHSEATQIVGRSVDGWTAGFPTELAFDGRPAMVAIAMNGEPLPVKHGFPARLMVPGLYGYVSATKWLSEIELTTLEAFDGYWIPRGWAKDGPIKTQSRIDVPRPGARVPAGRTVVAGIAWAPTRGVERVEVRVEDGGEWEEAQLSGALSDLTWVQWRHELDLAVGTQRLQVRATDGTGETQPEERRPPAPNGATGYHTIRVVVE